MTESWASFGTGEFSGDSGATKSVAEDVLDKFGIPIGERGGGSLPDVDIKHMDALNAIRLSLLDELGHTGTYREIRVTADGHVDLARVGTGRGVSNIYYTLQSQDYITPKSGVLVTGGKPLPKRFVGDTYNILAHAERWSASKYMISNCMRPYFAKYHVITYDDPHLSSSYADGISNLADITDPYTRLIGYIYDINPHNDSESVTISINKQASVPVFVSGETPDNSGTGVILGELYRPPILPNNEDEECYGQGFTGTPSGGIEVSLPPSLRFTSTRGVVYDKFIRVSDVFVIGIQLDSCRGVPKGHSHAKGGVSTPENTDLWVEVNDPDRNVFKLKSGIHYAVGYDLGTIRIQFADRGDPLLNPKVGDNTTAFVANTCLYGATNKTLKGSILPTDRNRGLLVQQVFAVVDLDTPCITIQDPEGNAELVGDSITFDVSAIFMYTPPAPMAYNGTVIDLSDGVADHDPTTTQDFSETQMEQVLKDMDGGAGMTLSLSSLQSPDMVARLSDELKELFLSDRGVTTTYICGPNCNPELLAKGPSGGIINEINYTYSDSGSYTISVTEGATLTSNFPNITTGSHIKMVEEVSAGGTVIQDAGNNVMYKVLVDGIGVREAINGAPAVIRTGDRVSVTIHNNPVEG